MAYLFGYPKKPESSEPEEAGSYCEGEIQVINLRLEHPQDLLHSTWRWLQAPRLQVLQVASRESPAPATAAGVRGGIGDHYRWESLRQNIVH